MDRERMQRVRMIFERAADLPAQGREAFLRDACGDDREIRAEVERLLAAESAASGFGKAATELRPSEPPAGRRAEPADRIGPYRLVRPLGEGGMGVVWEAEQEHSLRRRVALKTIKHGLDGARVLARFEAERQALALMNHPNIGRVLDAGNTEDGRPYFVMEFIPGVPITDYCDRHNLGAQARLDLMIQVCEGVQHAHQKGIIHRDLKPSNILVEIRDGRPVPRIIDFGVAKATERHLTERTLFTEFGEIIGTPEYMSPEQAEMTGLDIDTRTDVYSLGVILYELLVGALPFDPKELRGVGFDEMRRRIREDTPHKPSTRLRSLGDRSGEVARHRHVDPSTLVRQCQGDLDWITMKALDKDRTQRYASASELAADLLRHRANEPVTAGPPSVGYRARKFVRRHRLGVAFAGSLTAALLVGLVGTSYGLLRAVRAERQTRLEADTVRQVSDFMVELFEINDPGEARGRTVTAKEVLDRGATAIRENLAERPALQARLMESMGTAYRSLGLYSDSEPLLEGAVEALVGVYGAAKPETARARTTLGGLYVRRGRAKEAIPLLEAALNVQEAALAPDDLELARTLNNLGGAHRAMKQYEAALPYLTRALAIREKALGPEHPKVADQLSNLGSTRLMLHDFEGARRDLDRALEIQEAASGPEHIAVSFVLDGLATLQRMTGDMDTARTTLLRVLAIKEKNLGADNPGLVNTLTNLGAVARERQDLAEAEQLQRRALAIAEAHLDPSHPLRKRLAGELAATLQSAGKPVEP